MSPRSRGIAIFFAGLTVVACSSAPPKDDSLTVLPDREQNETEPTTTEPPASNDELVGQPAEQTTPPPAEDPTEEPTQPEEPTPPGATCTSNCSTANAKKCANGTSYQICKEIQPGCLKWTTAKSCGASMVCSGAGACSCDHQCTT